MSFSPVAGAAKKAGLSTLQRVVLGGLVVTLAGSAMLRAVHHSPDLGNGPGPGSSFVGVDTSAAEGRIEAWLPYLTEASFFGLIGFAVGFATRKLVRMLLIGIAIAFVVVQLLVSTGHFAVDWLGVRSVINQWIFNLKDHETITTFLTNRIPSAGALIAGWFFGFRRG